MQEKAKRITVGVDQVKNIMELQVAQIRRTIVPPPQGAHCVLNRNDDEHTYDLLCGGSTSNGFIDWCETVKPRLWKGDVVAVLERWRIRRAHRYEADVEIEFQAGGPTKTIQFPGRCSDSCCRIEYDAFIGKWLQRGDDWIEATLMPREAVRTYLQVSDVYVQRIQDISDDEIQLEGLEIGCPYDEIWNKRNLGHLSAYGWDANPWVFVYTVRKLGREEAIPDAEV